MSAPSYTTINYATKYSDIVDERFSLGMLTNSIVNNNYDWIGASTVAVYSYPTVALTSYYDPTASSQASGVTATNRYGTPSDLLNHKQELTVAQDKAFTFVIDRKTYDDTMMTAEAGKCLAREINEVIIPTVDKYRIGVLEAGVDSANLVNDATVTSSNAYAKFLETNEILDDASVPQTGRIAICTPKYFNLLKQDDSFIKSGDMSQNMLLMGQVGECDGVAFIKAPSSYFGDSKTNFIITTPDVMPAPIKLEEYKIHDNAIGISGWLVEGRCRFDAFILAQKYNAFAVCQNNA